MESTYKSLLLTITNSDPLAISLRFCRVRKNKKLYKEKYIYPIWRPKECYWVTKSMAFVMLLKIKFYFSRWSD